MIVNNHFETAPFCCCDEGKNVFGENPVLQTRREADRIAEKNGAADIDGFGRGERKCFRSRTSTKNTKREI